MEDNKPEEAIDGIIWSQVERLWSVAMASSMAFMLMLFMLLTPPLRNCIKCWMVPDEAIASLFAVQEERMNIAANVSSISASF